MIKLVINYHIHYLYFLLVMFSDRTVLFSLLTLFLFATTRETVMQNWAYLAFELMHKVSCSYRLQVRGFGVACRNSKVFKYKFIAKEKLSKKINVKQFPTLVEVHLITSLFLVEVIYGS